MTINDEIVKDHTAIFVDYNTFLDLVKHNEGYVDIKVILYTFRAVKLGKSYWTLKGWIDK